MRIKRKVQIVTAASQALALVLITPLAGLAQERSYTAFDKDNKLDNFEQVIYGAPRKNLSEDARLKALEIKLFGEAKSGTYDTRIEAIQKALAYGKGIGAGSGLLPPVAGTLDTSSNSGKTSKAPSYSDRNESFSSRSANSNSGSLDSNSNDDSDNDSGTAASNQAVADAMQLYTDGKIDQAEQAFRKIISNDPNNGDAYYNLGVIAEGRGDLKSALNDYRQAQRINPQDQDLRDTVTTVTRKLAAQGVSNRSVASGATGKSNSGKAPAKAPPRGTGSSGYNDTAMNSGSSYGGNSGMNSGTPADRNRLKAMVNDASSKYKKGDYDGAVSLLGQVANEAPGDADVQYALGQAYKAKGDMGRARTAMARAAALDPNDTSYQNALASLTSAAAASAGVASAAGTTDTGITPFAGSHATSSGSNGGLAGFSSRSSSSMNRRLTRAVEFGLAGAAVGGLTGALMNRGSNRYGYGGRSTGYSSMKSGALRGAVAGSVLGLIFGR